jgi:hypothetical protein
MTLFTRSICLAVLCAFVTFALQATPKLYENPSKNTGIALPSAITKLYSPHFFGKSNAKAAFSPGTAKWTGAINSDWDNPGNWTIYTGTPDFPPRKGSKGDGVWIPNVSSGSGNYPVISTTTAGARSIFLEAGATLTINTSSKLEVIGANKDGFINEGTFTNKGEILVDSAYRNAFDNRLTGQIINQGKVTLKNGFGKRLMNSGSITNNSGGDFKVLDGVDTALINYPLASITNNSSAIFTVSGGDTVRLYNRSSIVNKGTFNVGGAKGGNGLVNAITGTISNEGGFNISGGKGIQLLNFGVLNNLAGTFNSQGGGAENLPNIHNKNRIFNKSGSNIMLTEGRATNLLNDSTIINDGTFTINGGEKGPAVVNSLGDTIISKGDFKVARKASKVLQNNGYFSFVQLLQLQNASPGSTCTNTGTIIGKSTCTLEVSNSSLTDVLFDNQATGLVILLGITKIYSNSGGGLRNRGIFKQLAGSLNLSGLDSAAIDNRNYLELNIPITVTGVNNFIKNSDTLILGPNSFIDGTRIANFIDNTGYFLHQGAMKVNSIGGKIFNNTGTFIHDTGAVFTGTGLSSSIATVNNLSGSRFYNKGSIRVFKTASALINNAVYLNNTGQFKTSIVGNSSNTIINSDSLINNGTIELDTIGNDGIANSGYFRNGPDAKISLDYIQKNAINNTNKFDNYGFIYIAKDQGVGKSGILNSGTFANYFIIDMGQTGVIYGSGVDNTGFFHNRPFGKINIKNAQPYGIKNNSVTPVAPSGPITSNIIQVGGVHNSICSFIQTVSPIKDVSNTFINNGTIFKLIDLFFEASNIQENTHSGLVVNEDGEAFNIGVNDGQLLTSPPSEFVPGGIFLTSYTPKICAGETAKFAFYTDCSSGPYDLSFHYGNKDTTILGYHPLDTIKLGPFRGPSLVNLTQITLDQYGPVDLFNVGTFIDAGIIVDAGSDQFFCGPSSFLLNGKITGNYSEFYWSGGKGTFTPNNKTLNATYQPTDDEINSGNFTLALVGNPNTSTSGTTPNQNNSPAITCPLVVDSIHFSGCKVEILDPCTCVNNALPTTNGMFSNSGTFGETVTVTANSGQTWKVSSVTGLYQDDAATKPVAVGDALTETSPGVYIYHGFHIDSIGYTISVTNGRGITLSIGNKCFYPDPFFSGLPNLVLPTALPFNVKGGALNGAAGTGTFTLNGVTQTGAGSQPTLLTINPATLPKGTNYLEYTFDAGAPGSTVNDPGCVKTVRRKFEVSECGCEAINVTLNGNCQFLLTPFLVSNGNCFSGTVRVMDSDPSNGGVIDCAGVFTYGLFDDFNNLICWGKVTAEDKTAPEIAISVTGTFLCTEVSAILNNPKSVGIYADGNGKVGTAKASDNCAGKCACEQPTIANGRLKFSDKVVYNSCNGADFGASFVTAVIYRTWSATDCAGNTSTRVQEINFVRPALSSFYFIDDKETDLSGVDIPPYHAVTVYNSCTPDLSLIKENDYLPYTHSYLTGKDVSISTIDCFYSIDAPVDVKFPICDGKGIKLDRTVQLFDWCAGTKDTIAWTLIKIGDFEAPTLALPAKLPIILSTGPMDCTASFLGNSVAGLKADFGLTLSDNCNKVSVATRVRTLGKIVYGIVVDQTTWYNVDYRVVNGYTIGLPVGRHKLIISAYDGCYNTLTDSVDFLVQDRIAPVMKCNDKITVTLSNGNGYTSGYARVDAKDIDEGSTDNCNLDWIRVRRSVPASCYQSFIDKGYDTNGNGKLDTLDGFDNNGNGKLEPALLETFRNKNGTLMTPVQSFVEFFCCDAGNAVRTELWGRDSESIIGKGFSDYIYSGGNLNFCWQDIVIEDKVAPVCMAPLDVTIDCLDKNLQYLLGDAKNKSIIAAAAKIFGDVTIMSGSDCANLDTTYTVTTDLKCGYGTIKRSWTLTKKTSKGPLSTTCSQTIYVRPVHEYNICFPKDAVVNCRTKLTADTVKTDELACDILAVNVSDKRYAASDDECYKIFRTYTVINWCTYDDRCGDPMSPDNVYTVDRKWGEFGKYPTYLLVRQWEEIAERRRGYGHNQFFLSRDTIVDNWNTNEYPKLSNQLLEDKDDERIFPESDCKGWGNQRRYRDRDDREHRGFIHSWMYTQIIKVYDTERPVVLQPKLPTCTTTSKVNFAIDPLTCQATVSIAFKGTDNCSTALELEPAQFKIESAGGTKLPSDFDKTWSTARVSGDSFKVSIKNFGSGSYNLIVVLRDECGNLSVPTRIPFVVGDCKAPVPICIKGLATNLMPDGKGGGAMTVWAKDFIASPAYDCNGQGNSTDPKDGPNTKDGLKLITKYSINKVGTPADVNVTSLTVTCDDAGKQTVVEIHAWDDAGNHDYCVTYFLVEDNNKICPNNAAGVGEIAGLIQTEAKQSVQGVSAELSGKMVMNMNTASDGKYEFKGLEKGYDYSVTPSLDANPLNGVSTFDLVLMQKHILGIQPLDSPYKMIAADINNSKSITTLDLILLRKLILNLDTKFTANTSWRFVDAAYRFPNPSNPWSEGFPEISSINNLTSKVNSDFVAVKIGDVNGNASPISAAAAQPRKAGKLELSTEEQRIEGGQEYRVDIRAKDLKTIEGYQFTLELDRNKVDLVDIDYGVAKAENFGIFQREGIITTSWNRKGASENDDAILFTLHLQGKGAAKLSEALTISSRYTANEAYQEGGDYLSVAMNYTKPVVINDRPELLQNTPNPFADQTQIGFYLPQATEGRLTIRDAKGSIVYRLKADYNKGWNQVTIKQGDLKASGVLYYTLETPDFTGTKKMVLMNR